MGAEFEVVNLCLDQLPFGLRLLLPNTHTTQITSPTLESTKGFTPMREQALVQ